MIVWKVFGKVEHELSGSKPIVTILDYEFPESKPTVTILNYEFPESKLLVTILGFVGSSWVGLILGCLEAYDTQRLMDKY